MREIHASGRSIRRREFLVGAMAFTGGALLAACGTSPAAGTVSTVPAVSGSAGTPSSQGSGSVTVTWFAGRDSSGVTTQQVSAFNKQNTRIKIDYQEQGASSDDLRNKIIAVASAKDPAADLFSVNVPNVTEYGAAGWTIPVDDVLPSDERAKFFSGALAGTTYKGKLYAIPWYNNGPGLWYRKDLLAQAGLQPPKTYDELRDTAQKLQTPEIAGYVLPMPQIEQGVINWMEHLWGYGGDLVDENLNVTVDKGTAAVESLQRVLDFVYKDKIVPEYCLTLAQTSDAMNIFRTGKSVFLRLWYTSGGDLYKDDTTIKGQWDVTTLPSRDGAKPGPGCLGTWNLGVSAFSKNKQAAGEVIKWLVSQEQQQVRVLANGNLPVHLAVFENQEVQTKFPYALRAQESFKSLKPRPVTPFYGQISSEAIQPNLGAAMARQKSPAEAIKQMADTMRRIVGA